MEQEPDALSHPPPGLEILKNVHPSKANGINVQQSLGYYLFLKFELKK